MFFMRVATQSGKKKQYPIVTESHVLLTSLDFCIKVLLHEMYS